MQIENTYVYYLTGRGTTERYATVLAKQLPGQVTCEKIRAGKKLKVDFGPTDLLVLAGPVIGGYASPFMWQQLEGLSGQGTPAVVLCTFGACGIENTLAEMKDQLEKDGFGVVGAASVIARHSLVSGIAEGRPDDTDLQQIRDFGATIVERLEAMESIDDKPALTVPGVPGHGEPIGVVPYADDKCLFCGHCADECPADAIPHGAPNSSDRTKCISCMRCISACPVQSRMIAPNLMKQLQEVMPKVAAFAKAQNTFY